MVRLSSVAFAAGVALSIVVSTAAAAPPLDITEVRVDSASSRIVITGAGFGSASTLAVTLGEIGEITRLCSPQATTPETVTCDFARVGGLPAAGDYRLVLSRGVQPGQSDSFDLTIGAAGPAGPPEGWRTAEVAVGWYHACSRRANGTVTCWGDDTDGQSTPQTNTFKHVASGHVFTCGVKTSGAVLCWGSDNTGQVSGVPAGGYHVQVAAGSNHACGLRVDGTVHCWGYTFALPPTDTFTQIAAGTGYTCGIRTDGTLLCWGYNAYNLSPAPAGPYIHVSSGPYHSCAVKSDGSMVCWGSNGSGQVAPVPGGTYTQVAAGNDFSCGLRTDASVVCWGYDGHGQVSGAPPGSFSSISAKGLHACGVKTDGSVACWGEYTTGHAFSPWPPAAFP
jgi:hypothetical protein